MPKPRKPWGSRKVVKVKKPWAGAGEGLRTHRGLSPSKVPLRQRALDAERRLAKCAEENRVKTNRIQSQQVELESLRERVTSSEARCASLEARCAELVKRLDPPEIKEKA